MSNMITEEANFQKMSSNEERARLYYELVDSGRLEEMFSLFHNDIIYERGGTGTIQGIEELKHFYLRSRTIKSGKHRLDSVVSNGDWVAVRGSFQGMLKNGENVNIKFADFHQFRDGVIWRRHSYFMDRPV